MDTQKEAHLEACKKYREQNRELIRAKQAENNKLKYQNDPLYREQQKLKSKQRYHAMKQARNQICLID
jgi:hypothetical protein